MSPSEQFLQKIRGEVPENDAELVLKSATVRMNAALYGRLYALAEMAGTSFNDAAVEMIGDGCAGIYGAFTDEERERCESLTVAWLQSFFKEQREGGKK